MMQAALMHKGQPVLMRNGQGADEGEGEGEGGRVIVDVLQYMVLYDRGWGWIMRCIGTVNYAVSARPHHAPPACAPY